MVRVTIYTVNEFNHRNGAFSDITVGKYGTVLKRYCAEACYKFNDADEPCDYSAFKDGFKTPDEAYEWARLQITEWVMNG